MHPVPVEAVAATGLEVDDGRIIGVADTLAHGARMAIEKLDRELSERLKSAQGEPDRQREIEAFFRSEPEHVKVYQAAQEAFRELGRVLRMYQPELARQYIDGSDLTRAATHHAFRVASRVDPHAVEAFARSVLECPDAAGQERGPGVVSALLQPNLPALLTAYATELGTGERGARDALAATVGASMAAYNTLAGEQGVPTVPEFAELLQGATPEP